MNSHNLFAIIDKATSAIDLKSSLGNFDEITLIKMVGTLNDSGLSPYEHCAYQHAFHPELKEMQNQLLPYILKQDVKPLSTLIEYHDIVSLHRINDPSQIKRTQIACEAVNYARSIIKVSSTHPAINSFPEKLRKTIYESFEVVNSSRIEKMLNEIGTTEPDFKTAEQLKRYLKYFKDSARETKMGNCIDFSLIVFSYLAEKYPRLSQRVAYFTKDHGDHYFNFIGEGEFTIFCDAWTGVVCPISNLLSALKDYGKIRVGDTFYNCLYSFNPKFHKVDTWITNKLLIPPLFKTDFSVTKDTAEAQPSAISLQKKHCLYNRDSSFL